MLDLSLERSQTTGRTKILSHCFDTNHEMFFFCFSEWWMKLLQWIFLFGRRTKLKYFGDFGRTKPKSSTMHMAHYDIFFLIKRGRVFNFKNIKKIFLIFYLRVKTIVIDLTFQTRKGG